MQLLRRSGAERARGAFMFALIRSIRYNDTTATIANSAVNINSRNPKYYGQLGYGRIDVLRAVKTK